MGVYRVLLLISLSIHLVYSQEIHYRPTNKHEGQHIVRNNSQLYYSALNHKHRDTVNSTVPEMRVNDTQTFGGEEKMFNYRQGRQRRLISPAANQFNNGYYPLPPEYSHPGQDMYNHMPYMANVEEVSNVIEAPLYTDLPHSDYEEDPQHHEITIELPEEPEADDDDPEPKDEEDDTTEPPTTVATTTTTLAPFTLADVKVPAPFLRIEYMISFTFFGLMYGLGFFVLFQSLCVPAAKLAVYIVYMALLTLGVVQPVTLEQALEQLPPT